MCVWKAVCVFGRQCVCLGGSVCVCVCVCVCVYVCAACVRVQPVQPVQIEDNILLYKHTHTSTHTSTHTCTHTLNIYSHNTHTYTQWHNSIKLQWQCKCRNLLSFHKPINSSILQVQEPFYRTLPKQEPITFYQCSNL